MANIRRKPDLEYSKEREVSPLLSPSIDARPEDIDPRSIIDTAYDNLRFSRPSELHIEEDDPQKAADRVFLNLAGVKNKADILLDAIENNVRKNFIPVYNDSLEVIQAVKRIDNKNAPEGDKVHWDLFRRAVFDAFHQFDGITLDVLDNLTGEVFADSHIIDNNMQIWRNDSISQADIGARTRSSSARTSGVKNSIRNRVINEGPSILERLLVYGGSLAFIWFLNKKLAIFDAKDKAASSGTKIIPPGTEWIPMLIQILVGIAIHMMLQGMLRDDTKRLMKQFDYPPGANIDIDDVVDKAQTLADGGMVDGHTLETYPGVDASSSFLDLALSRMGEGDLEIIMNYSVQWLSTHNEEGYDEWLTYINLYDISDDITDMLEMSPQYSPVMLDHAKKANKKKVGVPAVTRSTKNYGSRNLIEAPSIKVGSPPEARYSYAHMTHADSWNDYRQDLVGTIQKDLLNSLQFAACSYNRSVNGFAAILTSNPMVADLVCCFVRFTGSLDPTVLKSIRAMIALFANGISFDLGGFISAIHKRTYGDLEKKLVYELLGIIDEVFNAITNDLLDWIDTIDQRLLICLPIDAMLNMSLKGLEDLKDQFKDLLLTLADRFSTKSFNFDKKITILAERKWARKILNIIDTVLMALQSGRLCQASDREYTLAVNAFVDDYLKEQDNPEGLYKSLSAVVNPTKDDTQSDQENIPGMATESEGGAGTSVDTPGTNPIDSLDIFGVPMDLDSTIVGRNEFNTFDGAETLITENGIDLPSFPDIISERTTWDRTVSAEQRESCIDKMTDSQISQFMQMASDLKGL